MRPLVPARRDGESIQDAIERIANAAIENAPADERTYRCPDCRDKIFIMVPCSDPKCLCARIADWAPIGGHLVARECLSCDAGISVLAGRWFKFVYQADRRGKPAASKERDDRLEAFLESLNPGVRLRLRERLDAIARRERASEVET